MIIFPRGYAAENYWCTICNYRYAKLDDKGKQTMERYRRLFPLDLSVKKGEVPTPFPILIDADRKLSKGLGLFMTEWGQNTVDRPEYDDLFKILEVVNGMR